MLVSGQQEMLVFHWQCFDVTVLLCLLQLCMTRYHSLQVTCWSVCVFFQFFWCISKFCVPLLCLSHLCNLFSEYYVHELLFFPPLSATFYTVHPKFFLLFIIFNFSKCLLSFLSSRFFSCSLPCLLSQFPMMFVFQKFSVTFLPSVPTRKKRKGKKSILGLRYILPYSCFTLVQFVSMIQSWGTSGEKKKITFPQLQLLVLHALAILLVRGFVSWNLIIPSNNILPYSVLSFIVHIPAVTLTFHVTRLVRGWFISCT